MCNKQAVYNAYGSSGWPDFLIEYDRLIWSRRSNPLYDNFDHGHLYIEFKKPGKVPTELQQDVIDQLTGIRKLVIIMHSTPETKAWWKEFMKKKQRKS